MDTEGLFRYANGVRSRVLEHLRMARTGRRSTRYLEQHNGKWRVTLAVPRHLHERLGGTRLKRSLNTDSLTLANALKDAVVAELRAIIVNAAGGTGSTDLKQEALQIAAYRTRISDEFEANELEEAVYRRADEIRGDPVEVLADAESSLEAYVHDPQRERRAGEYVALALGKSTPLDAYHDQYLAQSQVKPRTKADDRRALKYLETWCERRGVRPALQDITRRVATRFMDDLGSVAEGLHPVTLNKYLSRLSRYWQWLERREYVEADVWARLKIQTPKIAHNEEERAFTDEEVRTLLSGRAEERLRDVMLIAALTGARLDPIVCLKVQDCVDGAFLFKPQKKEKKARAVPIHTALKELVARRVEGKEPHEDLFPDWPPPKSNTQRERSFKTSNAFTAYRRSVGVDEVVSGKRRALVNFHSFRRYFITKAERAGQPEHIIAAVVGHKRTGMTLGRYSAGPLLEQARACVEAVMLPHFECR